MFLASVQGKTGGTRYGRDSPAKRTSEKNSLWKMDQKQTGAAASDYCCFYDHTDCAADNIYLLSIWRDGEIQFL